MSNDSPTQTQPEPGRFHFWLDRNPGKRPPDHLIPDYLKSTYEEWDAFEREHPSKPRREAVR